VENSYEKSVYLSVKGTSEENENENEIEIIDILQFIAYGFLGITGIICIVISCITNTSLLSIWLVLNQLQIFV
jgi:hypothetical protein